MELGVDLSGWRGSGRVACSRAQDASGRKAEMETPRWRRRGGDADEKSEHATDVAGSKEPACAGQARPNAAHTHRQARARSSERRAAIAAPWHST